MYYPGYREADLRLCFRLSRLLVFPLGGSNINLKNYLDSVIICTRDYAGILNCFVVEAAKSTQKQRIVPIFFRNIMTLD